MPASDPRPAATLSCAVSSRACHLLRKLTIRSYRLRRINGGREVVVVTLEQSQLKSDMIFQNKLSI